MKTIKRIAQSKARIFIISGPSGSGKTTLLENMLRDKDLGKRLVRSISFTTRRKRSRESNGKDYFFVGKDRFLRLRKEKKILEWTRYLGYYYATPKDFVDREIEKGKNVILCLDAKGMNAIKRLYPEQTVAIFVIPPSIDVLHHRIRNRCSRTDACEIKQRVVLAEKELQAAEGYDYRLVNKDLRLVSQRLKKIILKNIKKNR